MLINFMKGMQIAIIPPLAVLFTQIPFIRYFDC